LKIYDLLF